NIDDDRIDFISDAARGESDRLADADLAVELRITDWSGVSGRNLWLGEAYRAGAGAGDGRDAARRICGTGAELGGRGWGVRHAVAVSVGGWRWVFSDGRPVAVPWPIARFP